MLFAAHPSLGNSHPKVPGFLASPTSSIHEKAVGRDQQRTQAWRLASRDVLRLLLLLLPSDFLFPEPVRRGQVRVLTALRPPPLPPAVYMCMYHRGARRLPIIRLAHASVGEKNAKSHAKRTQQEHRPTHPFLARAGSTRRRVGNDDDRFVSFTIPCIIGIALVVRFSFPCHTQSCLASDGTWVWLLSRRSQDVQARSCADAEGDGRC